MSNATDSSTTINLGAGGDAVRDFVVTKADGTTVKIQAISVVDPYNLANIQGVNALGEAAVSDDLSIQLLARISQQLEHISELLLGVLS